jgi:hypothetical protein
MDLASPSPTLMYILAVGSLVIFIYGFYMEAHKHIQEGNYNHGVEILKILFKNGNFYPAYLSLKELNIDVEKNEFLCDLCTGKVDLNNLKEEVE